MQLSRAQRTGPGPAHQWAQRRRAHDCSAREMSFWECRPPVAHRRGLNAGPLDQRVAKFNFTTHLSQSGETLSAEISAARRLSLANDADWQNSALGSTFQKSDVEHWTLAYTPHQKIISSSPLKLQLSPTIWILNLSLLVKITIIFIFLYLVPMNYLKCKMIIIIFALNCSLCWR